MNAPQPSLYERIASSYVAAFGKGYTGMPNAAALIVGTSMPTSAERSALEASFSQLGYTKSALGWVALNEANQSTDAEDGCVQRLFNLVEGIGPLCVVALDHNACCTFPQLQCAACPGNENVAFGARLPLLRKL